LVLLFWGVSFFLFFFILLLFYFFKKTLKVWGFECGAEALLLRYFSFSIQFFIVGLIFVVFDLEVIFLMNIVFGLFYSFWLICFFVSFLLVGLFVELWGGTIF